MDLVVEDRRLHIICSNLTTLGVYRKKEESGETASRGLERDSQVVDRRRVRLDKRMGSSAGED